MSLIILGLGSNIGDREAMLSRAVEALSHFLEECVVSPRYETPALLAADAPAEWNLPFLNMAVAGNTTLSPFELLSTIKALETSLGRIPRGFWGPREIDLDILAYDDLVLHSDTLTLPHAQLLHRDFALRPFADIAPDWLYPVPGPHYGKSVRELSREYS